MSEPSETPPSRGLLRKLLVFLAALLALAAVVRLAVLVPDQPDWAGVDFYQFWLAGRAGGGGASVNVWSDAERARLGRQGLEEAFRAQPRDQEPTRYLLIARYRNPLETYSTPWMYTLFGVAASGDYERDMARFQHVSLAAFVLAMLVLARLAGHSWTTTWLLLALAGSFFAPTISDFRVGNVNRLQLFALALYLGVSASRRLPARHLWAGAVLGLAVAFKPNLAFPALVLGLGWIARGRWRKLAQQVVGALAGATVAVVLSSLWFGSARAWTWWSGEVGKLLAEYDHSVSLGNVALMRVLADGVGFTDTLALAMVLGGLLVVALWMRHRAARGVEPTHRTEVAEDATLVALGAGLSLLSTQLAWLHYEVLALPLAFVATRPGVRPLLRGISALALLAVALDPVRAVAGFAENELPSAVCVALGTLALFLLALVVLAHPALSEGGPRRKPGGAGR